ncbi:hypothetical protein IG631_16311 [Alternaria alternata]|nr:hypothetical protein IG631_16311 [Alternaria alternata]
MRAERVLRRRERSRRAGRRDAGREDRQEGRQRDAGGDGYGGTWPDGHFGQRSPVVPQTSEPGRGLSTGTSLTKPDVASRAEQMAVTN